MKKTMASNRLTLDLTDENKDILETLKFRLGSPFGSIVNRIISLFCNMPEDIKKQELDRYKKILKSLYQQMDNASPYEFRDLSEKAQYYMDMATFLNGGQRIRIDEIKNIPSMVEYDIEAGRLLCPDNWIVLNPEKAKQSIYAVVVECRKADYHMPHFLYFTNLSPRQYDDYMYREINTLCRQKYDGFEEIERKQVEPIYDNEGNIINAKEWATAPLIGYYSIYIKGDPSLPADYKPPMGAMIVTENPNMYFNGKEKKI